MNRHYILTLTQSAGSNYILTTAKNAANFSGDKLLDRTRAQAFIDDEYEQMANLRKAGYSTGVAVLSHHKQFQLRNYVRSLGVFHEVTEQDWWASYECLPPIHITHDDSMIIFAVDERITDDLFTVGVWLRGAEKSAFFLGVAARETKDHHAHFTDVQHFFRRYVHKDPFPVLVKLQEDHDSPTITPLGDKLKSLGAYYNVDDTFATRK